ncbi:ThiF family adenylyltransferase [Streptomyces sp. NPDC020801]|uniref:ThiF family adenylyltransferase n=1 Tax=Streptomyces sp. NPDC020801 TaxID=3365093 RepID=UPI003794E3B0
MSAVTLVLTQELADQLSAGAAQHSESAAVLIAGVAREGQRLRLLGRELHWVQDRHYAQRTFTGMTIVSGGYVPALRRAEELGAVAVWVHTHPGGDPTPSRRDAGVDAALAPLFMVRTGQNLYASVVVSPAAAGEAGTIRFSGTVLDGAGEPWRIERLWIVGPRFRAVTAADAAEPPVDEVFDRQVRALGPALQAQLALLRIGLVGAGGTGSAVGEQLARLGVGQLLVVDPDHLSASNLTRVHGAGIGDVGRPKAEIVAGHAVAIGLGTEVEPVVGSVVQEGVAARLRGCDLVFGCTDDHAGRMVLSRLSSYYLLPVIDCGVLISSDAGVLAGIDARISVLSPGYSCLLCRDRVDPQRAALEQMEPDERRSRAAEGYAPELPGVEPAVVAYTTLVAALAVNEMLERLVGYGVTPPPNEILARIHDRELSTHNRPSRPGHYCADGAAVRGCGDRTPLLETTWASP